MNIDRVFLLCLIVYVLWILSKPYRKQLRRMWQRTKARLPRRWKAKSPHDCADCRAGIGVVSLPDQQGVELWSARKSKRGRKKRVETDGFACPRVGCDYFGIVDAAIHALVGYGFIDRAKTIRKLCCQACGQTFSSRRGTPLDYLKSNPDQIEMVLWFLAEGLDQAVLMRYTGRAETTIARWLARAGGHAQGWHLRYLRQLTPVVIQLDELHPRVRSMAKARWVWLAIDPLSKLIPALHLGGRTNADAFTLLHQLKVCLRPNWMPLFLSDGLRGYFYAISAHFGHWFRPPRARTDHWRVEDGLLSSAECAVSLVKRRRRRKLGYTITRMICGKRKHLRVRLKSVGLSGLIQTAFIERVNLTLRRSVAPLMRKTWSLVQSEPALLMHLEWWRLYYHFATVHTSLKVPIAGLAGCYRAQTPAMAAGLTDRIWSVGALLRTPLIVPET